MALEVAWCVYDVQFTVSMDDVDSLILKPVNIVDIRFLVPVFHNRCTSEYVS